MKGAPARRLGTARMGLGGKPGTGLEFIFRPKTTWLVQNNIALSSLMRYVQFVQKALFAREVHAELVRTEHGGTVRRGRRKLDRPVSTRRPMHVVLTSQRACGAWSLRRHERVVRDTLREMSHRFGIVVYDFANVGSHLHLLVRARRRHAFQAFLRSFAGIVARRVTGARRGRPSGRFFSGLAWSRVVRWGRDYLGVRHYVFRNAIEGALGVRVRRALEEGPVRARDLHLSLSRAGPRPFSS